MPVRISDEILGQVEKPSRYVGNEWNMVRKDPGSVKARFAFCFPDVYEIGMSHLGMKILYHLLNEREDVYCERVFAPWVDMESIMRREGIPLFAMETRDPVRDFDIVGFTLQYEMSYTNVVNMLDLAGIPIFSRDRGESDPFVCVGGPCAYNIEPLAEIVDFAVMGEAEEVINEVMDIYIKWKEEKAPRREFLHRIATVEGVYVPSFYSVSYTPEGTVSEIRPVSPEYPGRIRKRIIKDLDNAYFPEKIIVPYAGIVHDRVMLEIFRGCSHGCRFCQAGIIYRPVRERTVDGLIERARNLIRNTGYEEISLTSLSTSDYSQLGDLTGRLLEEMEPMKVSLSLPSLRIDSFSLDLMQKAQKVRKSGLTFAPEAGTQRLRDVINKGVNEEDLLKSCSLAFNGGWSNVKLYFMLGLPTETLDDVEGIADLAAKVVAEYKKVPREKRGKGLNVTVSTSCFVPKPFTPFQWEAQDTMDMLEMKQKHLKEKIRGIRQVSYNWHDSRLSFLEAVIARGDRRLGQVIVRAWEKGCKFDGWGDQFKFDAWMEAFDECGIDPAFYANRKRSFDEVLPWDHIDVGVSKKFLKRECEKAYRGELTVDCRLNCTGCGAGVFEGGICVEHRNKG